MYGTSNRGIWYRDGASRCRGCDCGCFTGDSFDDVGGKMKNVILEYTSAVIGLFGTISFFSLLQYFFLGKQGFFAMLISYVVQRGM